MDEETFNPPFPPLLASTPSQDLRPTDPTESLSQSTSSTFEGSSPSSSTPDSSRLLAGIRGTQLTPIQQAALLQSLLSYRQPRTNDGASSSALFSDQTSPLPSFESNFSSLPSLPPSSPISLDDSDSMPNSHIGGLNELQAPPPSASSTSFAEQLGPNHLDELLRAQTNLDIWASTVFSTGSPGFLTPPAYPDPSPSLQSSSNSTLPEMVTAGTPFDWSTLYPQPPGSSIGTPPPHLPHPVPSGLPNFAFPQSHFPSPLTSLPPLHTTLPPMQLSQEDEGLSSRAQSPAPTRPSRSRRASKAPSRSASEGGQGSDTPSLAAREFMTPEEIEEDKRRRNTEASARFRAKKKQRNVALQETAAQLREKVAELEKEKEALTSQNRWLRDIISEKAEVNPNIRNSQS